MKTIIRIAKTELQTLFYSPIAWLILVIFTFQVGMAFADVLGGVIREQEMGRPVQGITNALFVSPWTGGIFTQIQRYLYLYIPLLTMGLMSRELNSGSIKLLYCAPISNTQIIFGKYLSMMVYALALTVILLIFAVFASFVVPDTDFSLIVSGLLGLYLLTCAYAAIGLFMSSLTSYQVVAAVLTLAMLAALSYVGRMWQDIPFVRDITYWLSISGRADEFINGLICSEDLLYFIIVIALFLTLAVVKLRAGRQRSAWYMSWGKYIAVLLLASLLGYITSRSAMKVFHDMTQTQNRTLTANSREVVKQLEGGLTITTYVNALDEGNLWLALPYAVNQDKERFTQYTRFKPEIRMEYVYYYDSIPGQIIHEHFAEMTMQQRAQRIIDIYGSKFNQFLSPQELRKQIDLSGEGCRFVRKLERESGEYTFLRIFDDLQRLPSEAEITAALKRLVMPLPQIGFVQGHGERDIQKEGDRNYSRLAQEKSFRYALINQGFDVKGLSLESPVPEEIDILVMADVRGVLTEIEWNHYSQYLERGGNLLIIGEAGRQEVMNTLTAPLGVQFTPGILVRENKDEAADFIQSVPAEAAGELTYHFAALKRSGRVVTMPGAMGLEVKSANFTVTPLLETASDVWNELETTNFTDETISYNPEQGETKKSHLTGLALSRTHGGKEQRIIVLGDADCISNGEVSRSRRNVNASNYTVVTGGFYWLSEGEVPIDVRRPPLPDIRIKMNENSLFGVKIFFMGILPILLAVCSILIWVRRRGR